MEILSWGKRCFECLSLPQKPTHQNLQPSISIQVATNESPNQGCKVKIPTKYRAFQDVFSKQLALKLSPYQPWDCAIELPPGASLPKRKIYPVSIPEQKATEEYVEEVCIYLSTSPDGSSFFFLWQKRTEDCSLASTIKPSSSSQVPVPLVPSALETLRGATTFTKLEDRKSVV